MVKSMLFRKQLYPKTRKKVLTVKQDNIFNFESINKWVDFARLTDIRSGQSIVKFNPYQYQIDLVDLIEANKSIIICKTRQLGITETIANYFLYYAVKYEGYLAVIFSKTQSDTSNIAKRLRRQIESLGLKVKSDSLTDIEFFRGGRILFRNSTPYGSRGLESVSHILFDEASFITDIEEIYKSALPTTSMVENSKVILLSTPNGTQGFFYDVLTQNNDFDALKKCEEITDKFESPFYHWRDSKLWLKVLIHWLAHPIYSQRENYLETIKNQFSLTEEIVNQEYNLSFTNSQESIFKADLIYSAIDDCSKDLDVYEEMICGLDCSSCGKDFTVLTILGISEGKFYLIDYYRAHEKTSDYHLFQINEFLIKYQPTKIYIESNSIGQIYYEQISNYHPQTEKIFTSQKTKSEMIARLSYLLESEMLTIPRKSPYIEELLNFRGGNQISHDDCVMSLMVGLYGYFQTSSTSKKISLKNFIL